MGNATCIVQDGFPALLWLEVLVLLDKSEHVPEFPHEILEVPVGLGHLSPGVLKGPGGVNCRDG